MPRRARIAVPGIPWHIIQRGSNRSACFYAEEDYRRYLDTLSDMSTRCDRFKEEIGRMLKRRVTRCKAGRPVRSNSEGG